MAVSAVPWLQEGCLLGQLQVTLLAPEHALQVFLFGRNTDVPPTASLPCALVRPHDGLQHSAGIRKHRSTQYSYGNAI